MVKTEGRRRSKRGFRNKIHRGGKEKVGRKK